MEIREIIFKKSSLAIRDERHYVAYLTNVDYLERIYRRRCSELLLKTSSKRSWRFLYKKPDYKKLVSARIKYFEKN